MVMVTTILEDAIAKSHRGDVVNPRVIENLSNVVGDNSVTYKDETSKKKKDLELT